MNRIASTLLNKTFESSQGKGVYYDELYET